MEQYLTDLIVLQPIIYPKELTLFITREKIINIALITIPSS